MLGTELEPQHDVHDVRIAIADRPDADAAPTTVRYETRGRR